MRCEKIAEISVTNDEDVVFARQKVRLLAQELGISMLDQTRLITAVSELARNIVMHAKSGTVLVSRIHDANRVGVQVIFKDQGPGLVDIRKCQIEGFSTVGALGLGLPGARRLVDAFQIESGVGQGTTVEIIKWK